jgi:hypothetical protein
VQAACAPDQLPSLLQLEREELARRADTVRGLVQEFTPATMFRAVPELLSWPEEDVPNGIVRVGEVVAVARGGGLRAELVGLDTRPQCDIAGPTNRGASQQPVSTCGNCNSVSTVAAGLSNAVAGNSPPAAAPSRHSWRDILPPPDVPLVGGTHYAHEAAGGTEDLTIKRGDGTQQFRTSNVQPLRAAKLDCSQPGTCVRLLQSGIGSGASGGKVVSAKRRICLSAVADAADVGDCRDMFAPITTAASPRPASTIGNHSSAAEVGSLSRAVESETTSVLCVLSNLRQLVFVEDR